MNYPRGCLLRISDSKGWSNVSAADTVTVFRLCKLRPRRAGRAEVPYRAIGAGAMEASVENGCRLAPIDLPAILGSILLMCYWICHTEGRPGYITPPCL